MKQLLPLLVLTALLCGCATTPTGERDIAPTIKTAAYLGTAYALVEHPEWRDEFLGAVEDLKLVESVKEIDLVTVLAIAHRLPIKELKDSKAVMLMTAAIILLGDYGASLPPDQMDKLRPVVVAMREGIELGLGPKPAMLGKATL
jgi:hypothetical protein